MAGVPMNSPMDAMLAMRMGQPQPQGVGQQSPMSNMEPSAAPGAGAAPTPTGDPFAALSEQSVGSGDMQQLLKYLPILQKLYPDLKLADLKRGEAELTGPTQEQFLGAAHAKHHGAKVHHVRNRGRGQRLHVRF